MHHKTLPRQTLAGALTRNASKFHSPLWFVEVYIVDLRRGPWTSRNSTPRFWLLLHRERVFQYSGTLGQVLCFDLAGEKMSSSWTVLATASGTAMHISSQQNSSFLDLPPEVRLVVYDHCFAVLRTWNR